MTTSANPFPLVVTGCDLDYIPMCEQDSRTVLGLAELLIRRNDAGVFVASGDLIEMEGTVTRWFSKVYYF